MLKQIFKYIFTFLAFVIVVTIIFSRGNTVGTAMPEFSSTSSHQFSWPSDDGQPAVPDNSESVQTVLARVANKLGVTPDVMAQAYAEAQSSVIPFSEQTDISQDWVAEAPKIISDNISVNLATMFKIMAIYLGIPVKDISAAWQTTVEELRQADSTSSADDYR
jgi:hypothetical protein